MRALFRAACLLMIGLGLTVSSAYGDDQKPCKRYRLAYLDITFDSGGRPLIETMVNGEKLHMLVDTGAVDSELAWATVERMKLQKTRLEVDARVYDAAGVPITHSTTVDKFSIGAMYGTNWPFLVAPEHTVAIGNTGIDGIVGPDILQKYDIEFDFAAGKFSVFTHYDCGGRVVYWTKEAYSAVPFDLDGYHMLARAKLDDETVDVMVDSGASMSNMTDKTAREIMPSDPDPKLMKRAAFGLDPMDEKYVYTFKTLDLNGLLVQNPDFFIYPERNAALHNIQDRRPTVVLGASILRDLHLYIAYGEKVMYFTKADTR